MNTVVFRGRPAEVLGHREPPGAIRLSVVSSGLSTPALFMKDPPSRRSVRGGRAATLDADTRIRFQDSWRIHVSSRRPRHRGARRNSMKTHVTNKCYKGKTECR